MTSCKVRCDIANSPDGDAQNHGRAVTRLQYGESGGAFAMRVNEEGRRPGAIPLASLMHVLPAQ
jgi:hypothetical protein